MTATYTFDVFTSLDGNASYGPPGDRGVAQHTERQAASVDWSMAPCTHRRKGSTCSLHHTI